MQFSMSLERLLITVPPHTRAGDKLPRQQHLLLARHYFHRLLRRRRLLLRL